MADDTNVGGIKGTLDLDLTPWDSAIAKAKSDVAELKSLSVDVKVTAAVDEAERQLGVVEATVRELGTQSATVKVNVSSSDGGTDAVAAAEAKLAAAIQVSENATARAQIAQLRLSEAEESGSRSAASLAASQLAASIAVQKSEAAATSAAAAEDRLNAVRAASVAASAAEASGENVVNEALETHTERIVSAGDAQQLMVAGIGALIVAIPALGGAVVGLGAALVTEGAAGAAAIYGITQQVKNGTEVGQQYSAGLSALKSELDAVSTTGANVMLSAFQTAEKEIVSDLPALNAGVATFAGYLGRSGDNLVDAAVKGFDALNPLAQQGAQYLEQVTSKLDGFAGSGEFQQFIAYAEQELPQVEALINNTVSAVFQILQGLAPVGDVLVTILTAVTGAISEIPVPVLTALAGAVAAVGSGFLIWKAIYPLITSVQAGIDLLAGSEIGLVSTSAAVVDAETGVATASIEMGTAIDFATGPIGLVVAAAAALGLTLLGTSQATQNATQSTSAYTQAIQEDSGALGENTRAQVAKTLQEDGAYKSALQLGISQKQLTDAVLGQGSALDIVNAKIKENGTQTSTIVGGAGQAGVAVKGLSANALGLQKILDTQTGSIKDSVEAFKNEQAAMGDSASTSNANAAAMGLSANAYTTAAAAASSQTQQTNAATLAMQFEGDAAGLVTNALTLLNGGTLSLAQAQTGFAAANNQMASTFKTNGTAISGNTAAAVANQGAIQNSEQAAQQLYEATATATGSTTKATAAYGQSKAALEAELKAQNDLTPQVQAYINTIFKIPSVPVTTPQFKSAAAQAAAEKLQRAIESIPKTVNGNININTGASLSNILATTSAIQHMVAAVNSAASNGAATPVTARAAGHAVAFAHGGVIPQHFATGGISGGPVWGSVGSATSDSIDTALSIGETVTNAGASSYPGVAPLLSSINSDPRGTMQALAGSGQSAQTPVNFSIVNKSGTNLADLIDVRINGALVKLGNDTLMASMGGSSL